MFKLTLSRSKPLLRQELHKYSDYQDEVLSTKLKHKKKFKLWWKNRQDFTLDLCTL